MARASIRGPSRTWTVENRPRYDRSSLRDPSDLTDAEWSLISLLIPPAKKGGNKRTVNICEVVKGLMYPEHRLPVVGAVEGPAARKYGQGPCPALAGRPDARSGPSRAVCRLS